MLVLNSTVKISWTFSKPATSELTPSALKPITKMVKSNVMELCYRRCWKSLTVNNQFKTIQILQQALWWCIQAKNANSIRKGYAPEVLVLGKHTRMPGSITSDHLLPAHALADADTANGIAFRRQLAMRECARRAFHSADNDAAIRKALLRKNAPFRGQYVPGEWVMAWKQTTANPGSQGAWLGPMKVVVQESQHTLWTTMSSKLYRCALEHVRPVSSEEARHIVVRPNEPTTSEIAKHIPLPTQGDITQYHDLTNIQPSNIPTTLPPVNSSNPEIAENIPLAPVPNTNPNNPAIPDNPPPSTIESQPDTEPEGPESVEPEQPLQPENVPIPDEDDDELICEGLYCTDVDTDVFATSDEPLVWRHEITITEPDINNWKEEDGPSEMAFLVSASKRQKSEVKLGQLTAPERAEFDKAKSSEVQNWLKTGTVERILRHKLSPDQILRCRWILTWKPIDPSDRDPKQPQKDHKAKARLVVLGYLDPKITDIPRDSPTLSRHSKLLILQLIASKGWDLRSFDVKAAFLQGQPQEGRILGVEPVPELAKAMGLTNQEVRRLTKGAYGLIDAPYLWYQAFRSELLRLGFQQSPFDPCTFILRCPETNQPEGILGIHVDDGLCGGNQRFCEKIRQLEKKYPFGSQKINNFTFTGIDLQQLPNKAIQMSQSNYVRKIQPISISTSRKDQPELTVTDDERQALRGLIGSLQYAAVHTRPDIASRLSFLQSDINSAKISTLIEANKTLHETKKYHDVSFTIQPIACEDLRFLAFSDASFASKRVPDSHTGSMIMSTHKDIKENVSCPVSPLSWGCKKIQRVVTSTLAAETVSLSSVLDHLSWIRLCWAWFLDPKIRWQTPTQTLKQLPESYSTATLKAQQLPESVAATDCKSLYDLVTRTAPPACSEFRTQLHARMIKDLLDEGVQLRWVHSGAQLADSLTKAMETGFLRETLKLGRYKLNDELSVLKARSTARNRIKWLKSSESSSLCCESCLLSLNFEVLGVWNARFTIAFSNQPVVTSNQGYTVFHGKPFNMSGNAAVMWLRRARSQRWEGNSLWAIVASWPTLGGTWQSLVSCLTWTSSFVIHLCALGEKALLGAAASVDQFT